MEPAAAKARRTCIRDDTLKDLLEKGFIDEALRDRFKRLQYQNRSLSTISADEKLKIRNELNVVHQQIDEAILHMRCGTMVTKSVNEHTTNVGLDIKNHVTGEFRKMQMGQNIEIDGPTEVLIRAKQHQVRMLHSAIAELKRVLHAEKTLGLTQAEAIQHVREEDERSKEAAAVIAAAVAEDEKKLKQEKKAAKKTNKNAAQKPNEESVAEEIRNDADAPEPKAAAGKKAKAKAKSKEAAKSKDSAASDGK